MNKSISVIVPIRDCARYLPEILPPLKEALARNAILELLVIDDASSDSGPQMCAEAGAMVIRSASRVGPGACRNLGAFAARGDILMFVDADVVINSQMFDRIAARFESSQDCIAVFGSYDDHPRASGPVSLYKNLLHHYMHQHGRPEAKTFWSGCGAVDRRIFCAVGGFDMRRYPFPAIEDIELGSRLRLHGRIFLDKQIQVTHLKDWTFRQLIATDIFRRALPWSRLLMKPQYRINDLNISTVEKFKAVLSDIFAVSLVGLILFPSYYPVALALAAAAWLSNQSFFRLVLRRGGFLAMIVAFLLHQLYYLYSSACFLYTIAEHRLMKAPLEGAATDSEANRDGALSTLRDEPVPPG